MSSGPRVCCWWRLSCPESAVTQPTGSPTLSAFCKSCRADISQALSAEEINTDPENPTACVSVTA